MSAKKKKEKTHNIGTGNKLMTTKPWFSKSLILNTQEKSLKSIPLSEAVECFDVRPS